MKRFFSTDKYQTLDKQAWASIGWSSLAAAYLPTCFTACFGSYGMFLLKPLWLLPYFVIVGFLLTIGVGTGNVHRVMLICTLFAGDFFTNEVIQHQSFSNWTGWWAALFIWWVTIPTGWFTFVFLNSRTKPVSGKPLVHSGKSAD